MKAKVLYLVYSDQKNSGGGHFYSLKAITSYLKNDVEFKILNIGAAFSKPLKKHSGALFINLYKYNYFLKILKVYYFIKDYNPNILHAFDLNSLFIARTISIFFPAKVVFTKCGGQNGSSFVPDADAQILFSVENLKHFYKHGKKKIPKYLLPNRVKELSIDRLHELKLMEKYDLYNRFIIMRISRFNPYYDLTFKQSISLLRQVQKVKKEVILIFIGQIQSKEYYDQLKQETKGLPVLFIVEECFTHEASRLLRIADIVVATGRGVMEACSLNKVVFCPVKNAKLPILLNDESFKSLFEMNFSERAIFQSRAFNDYSYPIKQLNHKEDTRKYFERYFSVKAVKHDYLNIYQTTNKLNIDLINFIRHALRFFAPQRRKM